jgi:hypothetical protein
MKHLLSSTSFLILNKYLAKKIGLKAAVLLGDLISKEEYFISNGMTDGWFFNTEANIQEDTTLNSYHQRKAVKVLKDLNFIDVKRKGIPAKQYFKINEEQVLQFLNNLSAKNYTTINKNNSIIINNKYFKKPKLIEVKIYCIERQNNVNFEAFYDFYESKNWMVGKNKMKDWKAAVRNWERRETKNNTTSKLQKQLNTHNKAKEMINKINNK